MQFARALGATLGAAAAGILALSAFSTPSSSAQELTNCPAGEDCFVIVMVAEDSDDEKFLFLYSHNSGGDMFELQDGGQAAFILDDDDTHSVTELTAQGWTLADIQCDGEHVDIVKSVESGSASVTRNIDDDDDDDDAKPWAVCLFVTEKDGNPAPTATVAATATNSPSPTATPTVNAPPATTTIRPPATGSGGLAGDAPVVPAAVVVAAIFMAVCASATLLSRQR